MRLLATWLISILAVAAPLLAQEAATDVGEPSPTASERVSIEERNKAIARAFYQDLWFSKNTDRYDRYVAAQYVVHDIGDDKNLTEPAVKQKEIADFLHSQGTMSGAIDFQIAEGDLVATRWQWRLQPTSLLFRLLGGREVIPIINVLRIRDGKIVEFWNHRHDIDTGRANLRFAAGLGVGIFLALPGWLTAFVLWQRRRRGSLIEEDRGE